MATSTTTPTWTLLRTLELAPATDGVSQVRISPRDAHTVLVASWDGRTRVYRDDGGASITSSSAGGSGNLVADVAHAAAVLCATFDSEGRRVWSGGLDRVVRCRDLESGVDQIVGRHDDAVRCCEYASREALLVSGGWDCTLRFWDARTTTASTASVHLSDRVYAMDVHECGPAVVALVATRDGTFYAFDSRRLDEPMVSRACTLDAQIRCLRCFDGGRAVLMGSNDGRVAVENVYASMSTTGTITGSSASTRRFAFKCHRNDHEVFPVNALAPRPGHPTEFVSAGADGTIAAWDAASKKRCGRLDRDLATSCAAVDFSTQGDVLVVAQSYTYERGDVAHPPDAVMAFACVS